LEGYVEDLHGVAARFLLNGKVNDIESLINQAQNRFRNPTPDAIVQLFNSLGMPNVLDGIAWRRAKNEWVKKRLTELVELRNRIAHGEQENVHKRRVIKTRHFVRSLAGKLDEKVGEEIRRVTSQNPW